MATFKISQLLCCLILSLGVDGNVANDVNEELKFSLEQSWENQEFSKINSKFELQDASNNGFFALREQPLEEAGRLKREELDAQPESGKDDGISDACLRCICVVESAGCKEKIPCGDKGKSCGPYQIQKNYWNEGGRLGKGWRDCVDKFGCAEKTVRGYMSRYATFKRLCRNPTCEDYARMHNGGPNGYRKKSTMGYWKKIQKAGCDKSS